MTGANNPNPDSSSHVLGTAAPNVTPGIAFNVLQFHLAFPHHSITGTAAPTSKTTDKLPLPRRRNKTMNLNTYKVHALGDYVETIRKYGTSDSYSTELVGKSQHNY